MIRAAVLGKPVGHSLSPLVHGLIYRELGLEFQYDRMEVDQSQALDLIRKAFAPARSEECHMWSGFSLTMPLKEVGFSLNLPIEDRAIQAHSINTITPQGSFNTDITGLIRVLSDESVSADHVVLLGSGATARSALVAVDSLRLSRGITIFRRDASRDHLLPLLKETEVRIKGLAEIAGSFLGSRTLLISTLPALAQESISASIAGFEGTLVDFSYAPWPSTLAGVVKGRIISGLPILVSQAVDQARLFAGLDFDTSSMYRITLLSTATAIANSG